MWPFKSSKNGSPEKPADELELHKKALDDLERQTEIAEDLEEVIEERQQTLVRLAEKLKVTVEKLSAKKCRCQKVDPCESH